MDGCTSWLGDRTCGATPARRYQTGLRCALHTPAAAAGRPEPPDPDPALTLDALRARAGRVNTAPPLAASQLVDDRAVASGKRRASPEQVREARGRLGQLPADLPAVEPAVADPTFVGLFDPS